MSVLQEKRVLKVNASWKPYAVVTVEEAFVAMARDRRSIYTKEMKRPYYGLHLDYAVVDGQVDFNQIITWVPVEWKDWIQLPVRNFDKYVQTSHRLIRVPTVIIANNYKTIPECKISYSKNAVWERDKSTCQITGEKVTRKTGNVEHLVARSKGGQTSFRNTYVVRKDINQLKGNLSPEDFEKKFGYKLPKRLEEPKRHNQKIENIYNIPDWNHFEGVINIHE